MLFRVVIALVALVGCRGGGEKTKRTGSAAPVEMIMQPQLPDGGLGGGAGVLSIVPSMLAVELQTHDIAILDSSFT